MNTPTVAAAQDLDNRAARAWEAGDIRAAYDLYTAAAAAYVAAADHLGRYGETLLASIVRQDGAKSSRKANLVLWDLVP